MISKSEFEASCQDWNIQATEQQVASWIRHLSEPTVLEQRGLENTLLRLQLSFAALEPTESFGADGEQDLSATLLGRALGNIAHHNPEGRSLFLSLAAVTFASVGNFATASVFAKARLATSETLGEFEKWILAVLAYPTNLFSDSVSTHFESYAKKIDFALDSGEVELFEDARMDLLSIFRSMSSALSPQEKYLAVIWEKVHGRYSELSAARILREHGFVHPTYFKALRATASAVLFPTQAKAIVHNGILQNQENALVLLPTSTGKSLLGELALFKGLLDSPTKPLAVYLAPYRALADQLVRKMKPRLAGVGVDCEVHRGGYLSNATSIALSDSKTVLVATPEAFDSLVRLHPEIYSRIAFCVFDEFHLVEQHGRGVTYEGLMVRFRALQGSRRPRILALSPVVTESRELSRWLGVPDENIVSSKWRPTGRRLAVAGPDGIIRYYTPGDQASSAVDVAPPPAWIGTTQFPHPIMVAPAPDNYPGLRECEKNIRNNIAAIVVEQYDKFKSPVLAIAVSRADTRRIASQVAQRLHGLEVYAETQELAAAVSRRFPNLRTLRDCLLRGVAYHNASLPDWVRERIEEAIERRRLRVVVSTTTLAEGVDLPFRVVVLSGWRSFQFGEYSPIPSLLFRNIAGRCGRAGAFAEGDTIIVDNPYRTELDYEQRLKEYERLYIRPRKIELSPATFRAVSSSKMDVLAEFKPGLESQLAAFIQVAPADVDHSEEFVSGLLAAHDPEMKRRLLSVVDEVVEGSLESKEFSTIERNSPLRLTGFGLKVLPSGISGRSASRLAQFLSKYSPAEEPSKGRKRRAGLGARWNPLLGAMLIRLQQGDFVDELEFGDYKRVGGYGYPIKEDNLIDVAMAWVSGCLVSDMSLVFERNRDRRSLAEGWLRGGVVESVDAFEEDLEQMSVFCASYLSHQWSWVLRASVLVAEYLQFVELAQDLAFLGQQMECGVDNVVSVRFLKNGCPVDRSVLNYVVNLYGREEREWLVGFSGFVGWIDVHGPDLVGRLIGQHGLVSISQEDVLAIGEMARELDGLEGG